MTNSSDKFDNQKYQEALHSCRIHQWRDIDKFLQDARLPQNLHRPFHELVISTTISREYSRAAAMILETHSLDSRDQTTISEAFGLFIIMWVSDGSENN